MIDVMYFKNKTQQQQAGTPNAGPTTIGRADDPRAMANHQSPVTFRGIVYPWQLDHMNHMNVQHYVGVFDQASWVLLSLLGLDAQYFRENRRGMAALEQTINYKSELRVGDTFEIRSTVIEVREKTILLLHNMHNLKTGILAASTSILGIHMDTEARKSTPLPTQVRNRTLVMIPNESVFEEEACAAL